MVSVSTTASSYWAADESADIEETTVGGLLESAAADAGDLTALVAGGTSWTFLQLRNDARQIAAALLGRFEPSERVAVWAPNVAQWVPLEYGAALAGVTLVTANPALTATELAYVLAQSKAAGIFLASEYRGNAMVASLDEVRPQLAQLRDVVLFEDWHAFVSEAAPVDLPEVSPDAPAQIQYTSGTTGFPKGVLLRHRGVTNNARFTAERLALKRGELLLTPMPLFHTAGCVVGVLSAVQARAAVCPLPAFEPGVMLELLEQTRATVTGGVPTMLLAMMRHADFAERDVSAVRTIILGGTDIPAELVREVEAAFGAEVAIVYGQTEASPVITMTHRGDASEDKAESLGQPLPQAEVKIAGEGGDPLPIEQVGEICVRGYQVMAGYFEMPEATAEAIDDDGWLHTGDLGSMDARGYLYIRGRLKEMIIRGGENIFPAEVEHLLASHPAVAESAVVGVPDDTWGEVVAAFVRLELGATVTADDLRAFVRSRLAPFKCPQGVIFVDEFPRTASGKVKKFALREGLSS